MILEGDAGAALARRSATAGPGGRSSAQIQVDEPERVVIDVSAAQPGFLVLADAFDPGWKAFANGREIPIQRANYLFRAVPVEAGQTRVSFEYRPTSLRAGLVVSAATGSLLLIALLVVLVRRASGAHVIRSLARAHGKEAQELDGSSPEQGTPACSSCRARASMTPAMDPSVKGSLVLGAVVSVRRHRDQGRISADQLSARLDGGALELIDQKIDIGRWYPMKHFTALLDLDWDVGSKRDPAYMRRQGEQAADRLFSSGVYQQLNYAERADRVANVKDLKRQSKLITSINGSLYNFLSFEVRIGGSEATSSRSSTRTQRTSPKRSATRRRAS